MSREQVMNKITNILIETKGYVEISGYIFDRETIIERTIYGSRNLLINDNIIISYDDVKYVVATDI